MKLRDNNRLREIFERVRQYSNIRTVGLKPLVLEWINTKEENDGINKQVDRDSGGKDNASNKEGKDAGERNAA